MGLSTFSLRSQAAVSGDGLVPIRAADLATDVRAAFSGKLSYANLSAYNAVQKVFYIGVIIAGIIVVLSGLAMWKPVQLQALTAVFGGYHPSCGFLSEVTGHCLSASVDGQHVHAARACAQ